MIACSIPNRLGGNWGEGIGNRVFDVREYIKPGWQGGRYSWDSVLFFFEFEATYISHSEKTKRYQRDGKKQVERLIDLDFQRALIVEVAKSPTGMCVLPAMCICKDNGSRDHVFHFEGL